VDYAVHWRPNIDAMTLHASTILSCPSFHHLNINDLEGAKRLIGELVKLDRLPRETSLQGLLLLRSAWCEYDTTMMLATRYKLQAKLMFVLQLFVAWCIVLVGTFSGDTDELSENSGDVSLFSHVLFGLATVGTLLSGCESLLNASARWHQLRAMACSLERTIWTYRSCVGRFQQSVGMENSREVELRDALSAWRSELVSAADLQATDLERIRSPKIFKHGQFSDGPAVDHADLDSHHSPLKPESYLKLRVEKQMVFYQLRLPKYARARLLVRVLVLLCGVGSSVLAYLRATVYVIALTSFAGMLVAWSEFSERGRKIERYSSAIRSLKSIISWWQTLSDVERAGLHNISTLVNTAEDAIADEQQAWKSTAARLATQQQQQAQARGETGGKLQKEGSSCEGGVRRRPSEDLPLKH